MSEIPECPQRDGWKWEEMGTQLCRANMLKGPYAIQWDKGTREWEVIKGHRAMTIVVATPFHTADKAMNKAERMAVDQNESGGSTGTIPPSGRGRPSRSSASSHGSFILEGQIVRCPRDTEEQ